MAGEGEEERPGRTGYSPPWLQMKYFQVSVRRLTEEQEEDKIL